MRSEKIRVKSRGFRLSGPRRNNFTPTRARGGPKFTSGKQKVDAVVVEENRLKVSAVLSLGILVIHALIALVITRFSCDNVTISKILGRNRSRIICFFFAGCITKSSKKYPL
jgi:hypothetical protein